MPCISVLEQLCDGACYQEEIVKMEKLMLQVCFETLSLLMFRFLLFLYWLLFLY